MLRRPRDEWKRSCTGTEASPHRPIVHNAYNAHNATLNIGVRSRTAVEQICRAYPDDVVAGVLLPWISYQRFFKGLASRPSIAPRNLARPRATPRQPELPRATASRWCGSPQRCSASSWA